MIRLNHIHKTPVPQRESRGPMKSLKSPNNLIFYKLKKIFFVAPLQTGVRAIWPSSISFSVALHITIKYVIFFIYFHNKLRQHLYYKNKIKHYDFQFKQVVNYNLFSFFSFFSTILAARKHENENVMSIKKKHIKYKYTK